MFSVGWQIFSLLYLSTTQAQNQNKTKSKPNLGCASSSTTEEFMEGKSEVSQPSQPKPSFDLPLSAPIWILL